jgi:hypothetical protein
MMVSYPFHIQNKSTAEKFEAYVNAHHDGDVDTAIDTLLLCHKYVTMLNEKRLREDLKREENQADNKP